MSTPLRVPALCTALILLAACGGGDPPSATPESGLAGPDRPLAWQPEELYAIGGFNAPEWAEFGAVSGIAFGPGGDLFVLDDQTATITQISPAGDFVRTISGPGDGPGELSNPLGAMAATSEGELVLTDVGHRGFVRFGPDGEWIENVAVDLSGVGLPSDFSVLPDGSVVGEANIRFSFGDDDSDLDEGEEEVPEGRPILRWALRDGGESEPAFYAWEPPELPEGDESELVGGDGGGRTSVIRMSALEAFRPGLSFAVLPNGDLVVSDSTAYRLKIVDPASGAMRGSVDRPIPPTLVDDRVRELERAVQEERAMEGLNFRGGGMSFDQEAVQNMLIDRVATMRFYPEIPVVEEVAADPLGRIWVQRSSGVPGEDGPTDLVTADGRYLGTLPADGLRIPDAFGPEGLIAVIETDEFDVATIRVMRIPTEMPAG